MFILFAVSFQTFSAARNCHKAMNLFHDRQLGALREFKKTKKRNKKPLSRKIRRRLQMITIFVTAASLSDNTMRQTRLKSATLDVPDTESSNVSTLTHVRENELQRGGAQTNKKGISNQKTQSFSRRQTPRRRQQRRQRKRTMIASS